MTSSFKARRPPARPPAFLCFLTAFLHVSGAWQRFVPALSPQICLPLLFSTLQPAFSACASSSKATIHIRFHHAAVSGMIRWRPERRTRSHVCFPSDSRSHRRYRLLEQHRDANSCWWPFPFSFVVTSLCQSECLTSGELDCWQLGSSNFWSRHSFFFPSSQIRGGRVNSWYERKSLVWCSMNLMKPWNSHVFYSMKDSQTNSRRCRGETCLMFITCNKSRQNNS